MKHLLWLPFLLYSIITHAQTGTFVTAAGERGAPVMLCRYPSAPVPGHYKHHTWATRLGRTSMIVGGGMAAVGGIFLYAASRAGNNDPNNEYAGDGYFFGGLFFLVGGGYALLAGSGFYIGGKIYEAHHRSRYSLGINKNGLGFAYHF